jgi:hypothetical protein
VNYLKSSEAENEINLPIECTRNNILKRLFSASQPPYQHDKRIKLFLPIFKLSNSENYLNFFPLSLSHSLAVHLKTFIGTQKAGGLNAPKNISSMLSVAWQSGLRVVYVSIC